MPRLKSQRHELFARQYVLLDSAADAYRRTWEKYPMRAITHPDSARQIGWQILHRPEVQARIEELRDQMAKKADITMDKVLSDLQEAMGMAKLQGKPSDIITAAMSQAKLVGLLRDRVETGGVGDFDGMENISEILQKVAEEAGPEAALALSKAFGIDNAETTLEGGASVEEEAAGLIDQSPPSDAVN